MPAVCLHDKDTIERFLRRNPLLHVYALGDLDPRFWPHTSYFALPDGNAPRAVALLYTGLSRPTFLAVGGGDEKPFLAELIHALVPVLPRRFYAHLTPGLEEVLAPEYSLTSHGAHTKMALTSRAAMPARSSFLTKATSPR